MIEVGINSQAPSFAIDLGMSRDRGHQLSSLEVDRGRTASIAVIHCPGGAGIHVHPEHGSLRILLVGKVLLALLLSRVTRRRIKRRRLILLG